MQDYLQVFTDWVTYTILGLVQGSPLASSVNFFIYDSIKVTLMLAVIVFGVAIIRSFITPQKVKKWVAGRTEGVGNVLALSWVSRLLSAPALQFLCLLVLWDPGTPGDYILISCRITPHQ